MATRWGLGVSLVKISTIGTSSSDDSSSILFLKPRFFRGNVCEGSGCDIQMDVYESIEISLPIKPAPLRSRPSPISGGHYSTSMLPFSTMLRWMHRSGRAPREWAGLLALGRPTCPCRHAGSCFKEGREDGMYMMIQTHTGCTCSTKSLGCASMMVIL